MDIIFGFIYALLFTIVIIVEELPILVEILLHILIITISALCGYMIRCKMEDK